MHSKHLLNMGGVLSAIFGDDEVGDEVDVEDEAPGRRVRARPNAGGLRTREKQDGPGRLGALARQEFMATRRREWEANHSDGVSWGETRSAANEEWWSSRKLRRQSRQHTAANM
jgi:hypothetical protein